MKRIIDKINNATKGEQFFILIMFCFVFVGVLGITGCGGNCGNNESGCEKPKCQNIDEQNSVQGSSVDTTFHGVSVPGIGGCVSSGKGCGSCIWPQACKLYYANVNGNNGSSMSLACDSQYYKSDGCFGCSGNSLEHCYFGFGNIKEKDGGCSGCFHVGDSGGCLGTDDFFASMTVFEDLGNLNRKESE